MHWTYQTIGQREQQQDAYLCDPARGLFIVADGMGGHSGGAEASQTVVESLSKDPLGKWSVAFWLAKSALGTQPGGSTATVCHVVSLRLTVAHIGDSSAWLIRKGDAQLLTKPHRWGKSSINRCLKRDTSHKPDITQIELEPGDKLLLATDGIEDLVMGDLSGLVCMLSEMGERAPEHLARYRPRDNLTVVGVVL